MKRIISLVLTTVLFVACLAVPVMADEGDIWVELLDYGYPDSYYSNSLALPSNGSLVLSYTIPGEFFVQSWDLLIKTDSLDLQISSSATVLTKIDLGNGYYRFYGPHQQGYNSVTPAFQYSNGSYLDILSFRVSSFSFTSQSTSVIATGTAYAQTNKQISMSYPDGPTYDYWSYSGDDDFHYNVLEGRFDVQYRFTDWRKYDFLDIQLGFIVSDITSVSAYFGNDVLPIEVTPWSNPDNSGQFFVFVSIDVSSLDRSSSIDPIIIVSGNGFKPQSNSVVIRYASGSVAISDPSPWSFWFINLQGWLSSGFSSVTSSLSSISGYIAYQTSTIINSFTSLQTHITDRFNDLRNWVNSGYMTITLYIQTWGQNISSTITSGVDRIVSALSPNGSANDFNDKVQQQGSELENMAGALGAVTRPDVSTVIPDIGGYLTVSGPVTLAAVFDPFWKNSYILRLLLGSLAVSVAFTVVYGGKK